MVEIGQDVVSRKQFKAGNGTKLNTEGDRIIVYTVEDPAIKNKRAIRLVPRKNFSPDHGTTEWLDNVSYKEEQIFSKAGAPFSFRVKKKTTDGFTLDLSFGDEFTCIDKDGNFYRTVRIGDQIWMAENLRTTKCSDDTPIPFVNDASRWRQLNSAAYTFSSYVNTSELRREYGALYNAFAAKSECNVCPDGWRVPTQQDFITLLKTLNPQAHLKLMDPYYWGKGKLKTIGKQPDNSSGWTALPAGGQSGMTAVTGGNPGSYDFSDWAYFWSTTERTTGRNSYLFVIHPNDAGAWGIADNTFGFSIRCIKNK